MKRILGILAMVALLFCAATVQAQIYGSQSLSVSSILTLAASSASNTTQVIDCRKMHDLTLQVTMQADAATTDNLTLAFTPSVDGTTYQTAVVALALPMTGATAKTVVTNIPTYGYGYLKLSYVTNAAATAGVTNLAVKYALKIASP